MAKLSALYDEDFVRWTEEQAAALRRAKGSHLLKLEVSPVAEPRAGWRTTIREARAQIESVLEDSPSLWREAQAMITKQIRAAAELAADDLGQHGEPARAVWTRLGTEHYTPEQVLGDWFPDEAS